MPVRYPACALAFAVCCMSAGAAHANGAAPDKEGARERFKQGAQAYSEGRFKDAIDLFFDADRLAPNPAFAYNIGLAYEELGDAANALRWYRSYLRDLPGAPDQAEVQPRIVAAERHLRDRGVQQVTVVSSPGAAVVSIDGRRVGISPWTTELSPGTHQMGLELRGFVDASASFELPPDHAIDVPVVLAPAPDTTTVSTFAPTPAPAPEPATAPAYARIRPLTWATVGVGVAGLGAALGFELVREGAVDDARHSTTNLVGKTEFDRARSYETAARVAVGVGGAVAALGGVLVFLDLSSSSPNAPRMAASVGCPAAACGLDFHGAF